MLLLLVLPAQAFTVELTFDGSPCTPGDTVPMTARLVDDAGNPMTATCTWRIEAEVLDRGGGFEPTEGMEVTFTCPTCASPDPACLPFYVTCTNTEGEQVWSFDEVEEDCAVGDAPDADDTAPPDTGPFTAGPEGPCGTSCRGTALSLLVPGFLLAAWRRGSRLRQDQ